MWSPLPSISAAVWQLVHDAQKKEHKASSPDEPSMPYFSLASCLRMKIGTQGTQKLRMQKRKPFLPRSSALRLTRQGAQQYPKRPET